MAEHFEVSTRTIYRDIEALSLAGIPIYTNKGRGGGISLVENYILKQSMFSEEEQKEILTSLQSLTAISALDIEPILNKLTVIFNKESMNWIDVDFSGWGRANNEREKFKLIKEGIINRKLISFNYFNSYGEKSKRIVEPLKLLFKGQGWYLYAFCRNRNDFRIFKMTRIRDLNILKENFERDTPKDIWKDFDINKAKTIEIVLKIDKKMAYRVYDEFDEDLIEKQEVGNFIVSVSVPEGDWIYGYILSFGSNAEVIEPESVRNKIIKDFKEGLKKYSNMT